MRNLCRDRKHYKVYREFFVATELFCRACLSAVVARGALVVRMPAHLSRVQARLMGCGRKYFRNTSPEPYRDIKCLLRHTAKQPLSRQKIFYRGRGTVGGLSRQASFRCTSARTVLLSRAMALAVAPPCRDTKNLVAMQGPGLCRDRGLKMGSSPFWPPAFPVPLFLFFFLSFPKHPKFNIT